MYHISLVSGLGTRSTINFMFGAVGFVEFVYYKRTVTYSSGTSTCDETRYEFEINPTVSMGKSTIYYYFSALF